LGNKKNGILDSVLFIYRTIRANLKMRTTFRAMLATKVSSRAAQKINLD